MDKTKAPSANFLAEQSPEAIEANRKYQEAVAKLSESLDARKNQFFDPVWLAAAQGFSAPTRGGGFFESLGNAAGKVGAAQELETKREQDIAQQRVNIAGQGVELQRMKARDAELSNYLGGGPKAAPVPIPNAAPVPIPNAAPTGPLSRPATAPEATEASTGALSTAVGAPSSLPGASLPPAGAAPVMPPPGAPEARPGALSQVPAPVPVAGSSQGALSAMDKPPGFEGVEGIQVGPPVTNRLITGNDYIRLNRYDSKKPMSEVLKEAQEINKNRYVVKEAGVLDLATNKYYAYPTGKMETMQIHGFPGTYPVPANVAAQLSLYSATNDPRYWALANRVVNGPDRPVNAASKNAGEPSGTPDRIMSVEELATKQEEDKSRATELGKADAKKVSSLSDTKATAARVYGSATRVLNSLKESPNFFGIFERTGYGPAILGVIDAGIRTQSGSISIGDLQSAVTKVMPNVSQKDLDNVKKATAELAEIELQYTKLYLSGDGAITEGERKIVRAIPGTVSSSPEVLRTRMELLKARSQFDLDVADAFEQWQDKNPGRPYREFERKSSLYKDIKKGFEEETEKMFGGIKAVPTRQRKEAAGKDLSSARARVDALLKD